MGAAEAAAATAVVGTGATSRTQSAEPLQERPARAAGQLIQINEQQMLRMRGELDVVHDNMRVLSEMLAAHSAGLHDKANERVVAEDMELLTVGSLHSSFRLESLSFLGQRAVIFHFWISRFL